MGYFTKCKDCVEKHTCPNSKMKKFNKMEAFQRLLQMCQDLNQKIGSQFYLEKRQKIQGLLSNPQQLAKMSIEDINQLTEEP